MNYYRECRLCPRDCGVDRSRTVGVCGQSDKLYVARAALHMWEEPCISGESGSGACIVRTEKYLRSIKALK